MNFQISKNDIRLIILCSFIFISSLLILFFDLFNGVKTTSDQPVVAQTLEINNDVRVKSSQHLAWSKSRIADQIRIGDQVFTGENSTVTLQFQDNQKLNINQNSLVKFENKKNIKNFKIVFGSMTAEVKQGELIDVVICGEKIRIKAESDDLLQISNNENCHKPEIKMNKAVKTVNIKPKQRKIASISRAIVEKIRPPVVEAIPPVVVEAIPIQEPAPPIELEPPRLISEKFKFMSTDELKTVSWNSVEHADSYKIKVFDENKPEKTFQEIETKSTFFNFQPEKIDLKHAFSVTAVTAQKEFINSKESHGKVEIEYPPIKIYNPEKTYMFNARTSDQVPPIIQHELKWDAVPEANYYKVQVAKENDFNSLTYEDKTKKSKYNFQIKENGKFYYRILAFNGSQTKLTHSTKPSYVEYIKNFDLNPPELLSNMKNQVFFFQKTEGQFIRLAWSNKQSEKAPKYFIEISQSLDFSTIYKKYSSEKEYLLLSESIPQGQYFWRVKSYGAEIVSDWSETGRLKIVSKRVLATENEKIIQK